MQPSIQALIIIVNYFNDREVIDFVVKQLHAQQHVDYEIYVVNNGAENKTELETQLVNKNKHVLLNPGRNLGYLPAAIFAVEFHLEKFKDLPPYIILTNSDIEINDPFFLKTLFEMYNPNNYACIGPKIISLSQHINQNPYYRSRIKKGKIRLMCLVHKFYLIYLIYQSLFLLKNQIMKLIPSGRNKKEEVYALHGSFIIFNHQFLRKGMEHLKKAPFLFGEEIFIAEVARNFNMKMLYDPMLEVKHREHTTTKTFKNKKSLSYLFKSTQQIYNSFFKNT